MSENIWVTVNMPWEETHDAPGFSTFACVGMVIELTTGERFLLGDCDINGVSGAFNPDYDERSFPESAIVARYCDLNPPPRWPQDAEHRRNMLSELSAWAAYLARTGTGTGEVTST